MACEIISSGAAVFSVWGTTSREDLDRVFESMRVARDAAGGPITYVTRVPADAPPPEASVRRHLDTLMPLATEYCSSYHVILEGAGFVAAVKRSVLVGLFQIRWRRGLFFIHASHSEVLPQLAAPARPEVERLLQRAHELGLFEATPH
ncbi:MAG: hypothetical protein QM756_20085 [Polyangiaceae bacterium]